MYSYKLKSQIPISKSQINKFWSLVIIWNLVFGYWNFSYLFAQDEVIYDSQGKRDPFISLVTPDGRLLRLEQETIKGLLLEGIIYDKNGLSYAVVNGEVLKAGDIINEYQILNITENKVIFSKEGQLTEVELKEEER